MNQSLISEFANDHFPSHYHTDVSFFRRVVDMPLKLKFLTMRANFPDYFNAQIHPQGN